MTAAEQSLERAGRLAAMRGDLPPVRRVARPAAWMGITDTGLVAVCGWHDAIVPGSKAAAEQLAHRLGLHATHGICPVCKARVIAEAKEATP